MRAHTRDDGGREGGEEAEVGLRPACNSTRSPPQHHCLQPGLFNKGGSSSSSNASVLCTLVQHFPSFPNAGRHVRALLAAGCDVNAQTPVVEAADGSRSGGDTPLHLAVRHGLTEVLELLLPPHAAPRAFLSGLADAGVRNAAGLRPWDETACSVVAVRRQRDADAASDGQAAQPGAEAVRSDGAVRSAASDVACVRLVAMQPNIDIHIRCISSP